MPQAEWRWRAFADLDVRELHDLLKLRCDVFVVEQACAFAEIDGRDPEATHLLAFVGGDLAGCLRVFDPTDAEPAAVIGRVALGKAHRGAKLSHGLMREAVDFCAARFPGAEIVLSAQSHLQSFYARHGFLAEGEAYLEDGIPHIDMRRSAGLT